MQQQTASETAKVLVVANGTASSNAVLSAMRRRAANGPAEFTLVVPSTPHGLDWLGNMFAGREEAKERMQAARRRMAAAGLDIAEARVGDPDPMAAVQDALNFGDYDEIAVATPKRRVAEALKVSFAQRVRRITDVPVVHVEASARPEGESRYLADLASARALRTA